MDFKMYMMKTGEDNEQCTHKQVFKSKYNGQLGKWEMIANVVIFQIPRQRSDFKCPQSNIFFGISSVFLEDNDSIIHVTTHSSQISGQRKYG